jgi:tetratricopeptide (TPR) repeat protein
MAGAGLLDDALEACNEAIKASKLDSRFYYIKATILMEMGRNTDALNSLRQLLFIDPDHAMGHFSTGYILMKQGDIRKAKLFYGNVLNITKNMSDAIILPCSEGLSLGHIRDTINSNQVLNF